VTDANIECANEDSAPKMVDANSAQKCFIVMVDNNNLSNSTIDSPGGDSTFSPQGTLIPATRMISGVAGLYRVLGTTEYAVLSIN